MALLQLLESQRTKPSGSPSIILPGCFNGLTARLAADVGFEAAYVSGAAVSAAKGVPDIGIVTLTEFCDVIRDVSRSSGLPILCDADTGFGEEEMTRRTVAEYHHAGASGFHIEDQVLPKRCGHLAGKHIVSIRTMVEKVTHAVQASKELTDGDFVVCARTDARGITSLEEAIARSISYAEAGAHMVFPEGLTSAEEFRTFSDEFLARCPNTYLLANMTEFGKSPCLSAAELGQMGYDVVIVPVSSLRSAMGAVKDLFVSIKEHGKVESEVLNKMQTREDLYRTLRYAPGTLWKFPSASKRSSFF